MTAVYHSKRPCPKYLISYKLASKCKTKATLDHIGQRPSSYLEVKPTLLTDNDLRSKIYAARTPAETVEGERDIISDIGAHVTAWVLSHLDSLPADHPIYGPLTAGYERLPYVSSRPNRRSWTQIAQNLGDSVKEQMGPRVPVDACWVFKKTQIAIARQRRVTTVRLLASLADPTPVSWRASFGRGAR